MTRSTTTSQTSSSFTRGRSPPAAFPRRIALTRAFLVRCVTTVPLGDPKRSLLMRFSCAQYSSSASEWTPPSSGSVADQDAAYLKMSTMDPVDLSSLHMPGEFG